MKPRFAFLFVFSLIVAANAEGASYKIDPDHSTVGFKIKHLAVSSVTGGFTTFSGTLNFDPADIASSSVNAAIQTASINTRQAKRDEHLRSPDFFDSAAFPEIRFVSKSIKVLSKTSFEVSGDLGMHGVTKPVTLAVNFEGETKDPWGGQRAGFSATTRLFRKDFGIAWSKTTETGTLLVGDEVSIDLQIEAVRQP